MAWASNVSWQEQAEAAQELRQCMGTARKTGKRCRRRIKPPLTVCTDHGGKPTRHKERKLKFEGVDEVMEFYDPDASAVTDPFAELQRLGGIVKHAADVAGQKVNTLEDLDSTDSEGRSQIKGSVQILMNLLKLCESVNSTLVKLKIDEKVVEIEKAKVALIGAAMNRAFSAVQLSVEQRGAIDAAFAGELRSITAGQDPEKMDEATLIDFVRAVVK